MTNAPYSRAGEYYSKEFITPLREILVGQKAAVTNPYCKGKGIQKFTITTLGTMSAATVSYKIPSPDTNADDVTATEASVDIPIFSKQWKLDRMKADAYERQGTRFDVIDGLEAARKVAEEVDDCIFNGWTKDGTNYEFEGFYNGADNDYSTASHLSTFGNCVKAVTGAKALASADTCKAASYTLFLNPQEYETLEASFSSTGGWEIDVVRKLLGPAGSILETNALTAGTGLMCPVDPSRQYIEFLNPVSYAVDLGFDSRQPSMSPLNGTVATWVRPVIKHANALIKLSDLA